MELRSRRVVLRDWRAEDLPRFRAAFESNTARLGWDAPYQPLPSPAKLDQMLAITEQFTLGAVPEPRTELAICTSNSSRPIGRVSRYWQSEETNWLGVGIALFAQHCWGAGLGTEALTLWCDYLFATMPELVHLDLRTCSGNERMVRLATTLGFREEARFRKAQIGKGEYCNGLAFGILREEWTRGPKHAQLN